MILWEQLESNLKLETKSRLNSKRYASIRYRNMKERIGKNSITYHLNIIKTKYCYLLKVDHLNYIDYLKT